MAIYSTTHQMGIDVNQVFFLDPGTAEYPAPPFQPGELAWGTDGSEWVYCTASISIAPGNAVFISQLPGSWSVLLAVGATVTNVGLNSYSGASVTVTTTTPIGMLVAVCGGSQGSLTIGAPSGTQIASYFWAQRAGNCPNLSMQGTGTTFTQLRTATSNAGSLTAGAGGGTGTTVQINGIVWSIQTASAGSVNPAILNYPFISAAN